MKIYFNWRTTVIGLLLALGMVRLSIWQWHRHLYKEGLLHVLDQHLEAPALPLSSLLASGMKPEDLIFRRVHVRGTYDFAHEMVLRNRRYKGIAGVSAITPLKIEGSNEYVLVDRGFLPLSKSSQSERKEFQKSADANFLALVKETMPRKFLAPPDPTPGKEWVDAWLRVDIEQMKKQLPYPVLPVYVEVMDPNDDPKAAEQKIIVTKDEREEMLFLGDRAESLKGPEDESKYSYPVPLYSTVVPPARHLGYVYEWAFMALMTLLITFVLQLRPPPKGKTP